MSLRRAAATTAALALSFPGAALAQSAGDDQYRDPFGEGEQQQETAPQDTDGSGQAAPDTRAQSAPAPAPAPAPSPAAAEPTATTAATLPRTGLGAGLVAALGVVLLGAGVGLRRAADRPRN